MKISDEARELVKALCLPYDPVWLAITQTALDAAYNRGLDDAVQFFADKLDAYDGMPDSPMKHFALEVFKSAMDEIRAMKVKL